MKFRTIIIIVLLTIGCGCATVSSLLHSGAVSYLDCYDAQNERIHAEDDMSKAAVACRETFGGGD